MKRWSALVSGACSAALDWRRRRPLQWLVAVCVFCVASTVVTNPSIASAVLGIADQSADTSDDCDVEYAVQRRPCVRARQRAGIRKTATVNPR